MSTVQSKKFPNRLPLNEPPPLQGTLVDGRRTPLYALAWVCRPHQFYTNLGGGTTGKIDECNYRDLVFKKWDAPELSFSFQPIPVLEWNGNYYLIALFNRAGAKHLTRVLDVASDNVINAARIAMGVDQDPSIEKTLQWFRYPLDWVRSETTNEELRRLFQLDRELLLKSIEESASTSVSGVQ
ncbi:hypothetical protein B0H15DRAFT_825619 [Mycena belliarum]|uniref:Uncharacterized protein n=1 Tax=Mycena belliarum TaxID=1033014 RepID=A0AAD6UF55_9AGAR|nr:hypothetical protein B0H15DRAFT_825619 [Mycena belliae]